MSIQFITRPDCPVCNSTELDQLCEIDYDNLQLGNFIEAFYSHRVDREALSGNAYRVTKCKSCGLIYQPEVLSDEGLGQLYGHWIDADKSLEKKLTAKSRLFKQYAGQIEMISNLVSKRPNQTRVLEFGMGWGYWCRMAQAFGYQVTGLELSERRVNHARSLGINVVTELPSNGSRYDFIFSNQVFEHLSDPLNTLLQLKSLLADDGYIYIRVPDGRLVEGKLRKQGWSPDLDEIHPLEHINCFTRTSLANMALRAGLIVGYPPVRLRLGSLWGGMKREFNDRFLTTHMLFRCKA